MAFDGFKAGRKTYPIRIQANDMSGAADYKVYLLRGDGAESRLLARNVSEDQVQCLLSELDYVKFRDGKGDFRVTGFRLAETLEVIM